MDPRVHRRPRRLADLGRPRPRRAAARSGSPRSPAATTRWTATSTGNGRQSRTRPSSTGIEVHGVRPRHGSATKLRRGRDGRVHRADRHSGPAAARPERLGDLLQLPPRPRQAVDGTPPGLTVRCDDDDALPRRFRLPRRLRGAGRPRDDGRGLRGARHPAAARRRDREVRARDVLLQRRPRGRVGRRARILVPSPRDVPSYDHKPEMSVAEVADEFDRTRPRRLRLRNRQPRQPGHGRPHRLDSGGGKGGRGDRRRLGRIVAAVEREGGVALITADHGNAEEMLDADGKPANRSHLESRTAGRD